MSDKKVNIIDDWKWEWLQCDSQVIIENTNKLDKQKLGIEDKINKITC